MKFTDSFIQQVKDANNLVDLISDTTTLKTSSGGYMGRCPFPDHAEKTASFSVSEVKQVYHCFGCQKSGNLITFMRDYHGMSFPESIEYLANRASIPIPVPDSAAASEDEKRAEIRRRVYKANEQAQNFFRDSVRSAGATHPARLYFDKRGITPEIIELFGLGYVGESWDGLTGFLRNRSITTDTAVMAGLIKARNGGNGHFDLFRDRVMFPIRKISGEVVGFGGRILEKGEPKYLNSPETPVFSKGRTLYGLDQTARYIRSEDRVILVEGYMDLIAMFQAGVHNVAATLGTALTLDHAWAIKKMTPNITVLFDGDSAGQNAAEKSLPILLQAGLRPRGLTLPDNQDPDDFITERGPAAMIQVLEQAPDLFNLCLHQWTLNYRGGATEKLAIIEKVKPMFDGMQDSRLHEMYLKDLGQKLQMKPFELQRALSETDAAKSGGGPRMGGMNSGSNVGLANTSAYGFGAARPAVGATTASATAHVSVVAGTAAQQDQGQQIRFKIKHATRAERLLLSLVLKNRANFEFVHQQGIEDVLPSESIRQIFIWVDEMSRQSPERFDKLASLLTELVDDPGVVFEFVKNSGIQNQISEISSNESGNEPELEYEAELLRDCVRRIRADGLKKQIEQLTQDLRIQSTSENLEKLMRLQRERMALMNQISKDAE